MRQRERKYLEQVRLTGRDPRGLLGIDTVKKKTYLVTLSKQATTVGLTGFCTWAREGYVWTHWKTLGRKWLEPDLAPLALRRRMEDEMNLAATTGIYYLAEMDGQDEFIAVLSVESPYTNMSVFNRTRDAAVKALESIKDPHTAYPEQQTS